MTKEELSQQILAKKSYLCVGLDTDPGKIPPHLLREEDPVFSFNKAIIDATHDLCVAYKPNIAFYESLGPTGWVSLQKTLAYIPNTHFTIADAKRGDIGNTSGRYAAAFFEQMNFDAITIAPYMGVDSVTPFLAFNNKWVILLALTSNPGSNDFQRRKLASGEELFETVLKASGDWATAEQMMYVVGATHPEQFSRIRSIVPEHFLLVPGVGAQGGDLAGVSRYGFNDQVGILVNSSRGILYAGQGKEFAIASRRAARKIQEQMQALLQERFF